MKRCFDCKQLKSESEFYKNKTRKDGLRSICKFCANKRFKIYYLVQGREKSYLHKYKITFEQKIQMLKDQTGQCIVCGKQIVIENACVDHDHETGKIRGILCHSCNKGLGYFYDNSLILTRAAKYIDSSKGSMLTSGKDRR